MSVGAVPNAAILHHAGARVAYDEGIATFAVRSCPEHLRAAGAVAGHHDIDAVLAAGARAGAEAAQACGHQADLPPPPPEPVIHGHPWPLFPHAKGRDFVDLDEDLQSKDIVNATLDGYQDIQLLKRYTTVGMGPSQGRHSALPSVRIAARATDRDVAAVGSSTVRPPIGPLNLGHLAGRAFDPVRHTAMHHRHKELGARMMVAGAWLRPAFYGAESAREASIRAEAMAVREGVGLIDVSTLGGLDVRGADAAEFLNRMYTFAYLKQPVGRARYVLMTDESGVIVDDGVACRFHDRHFYVTATTSGVDAVYRAMLWQNAQWRLDVDVTHVTAAYAGVNIAGPRSREVLARVCDDVDLSADAFPYMGVRLGTVAGIPARLLRVGFVGELGYEIHISADQGEALWDALMEAGREAGIRPFGVEAQRLLRLEKGHIIIGQDTDGLTNPFEADMAWAVARKKPFFVGQRSLLIQEARGRARKLVGFTTGGDPANLPSECHLVIREGRIAGRVTSAAFSPSLARVVGLAYVEADQAEAGTVFDIRVDGGRMVRGEVVPLPFYDPENKRQEM